MPVHRLPPGLLENRVRVVVIGCGGTGSAVASGLGYLHQSMRAFGHPHGLGVTLVDGDEVSATNCARQPFSRGEIGHNKAVVLATRMNAFWGFSWDAVPRHLGVGVGVPTYRLRSADIVIGCVDTRRARAAIAATFGDTGAYWLDFGNDAEGGQYVLGEFPDAFSRHGGADDFIEGEDRPAAPHLPNAADLWPEILNEELDGADGPSCSTVEALTRQAPFVNQVLANHGLELLARLFRYGEIHHHGAFTNLAMGVVRPMPVPDLEPVDAAEPEPGREEVPA